MDGLHWLEKPLEGNWIYHVGFFPLFFKGQMEYLIVSYVVTRDGLTDYNYNLLLLGHIVFCKPWRLKASLWEALPISLASLVHRLSLLTIPNTLCSFLWP